MMGAILMLIALILVCSLATVSDLGDCTRDNALDVVYVPATFASPVTCLMHGQAYVADSSIGRDLAQTEAIKGGDVAGSWRVHTRQCGGWGMGNSGASIVYRRLIATAAVKNRDSDFTS
jgi:hypothetical protein